MPGTIVRALRDAESRNPVFLVDEIDKMGADFRGDPASAMLEVLDPEQHATFRDHYLDLPFDLSQVLFVCTANQLETIPPPLLDRMDVIELSGYTEDEKVAIAQRYLIPKQLDAHGLERRQAAFTAGALRTVIRDYTREAGVRNLERRIAALCRKAALAVADGKRTGTRIDERRVTAWLGPRRFHAEARRRTADAGVATGLAVTAAGGDVLFVEATAFPGEGRLNVTGQLGDVMQESAQAAHSWARAHASRLGIDPDWFTRHDVHMHVPAGAVPKDGPSAGITIATAIVSLGDAPPGRGGRRDDRRDHADRPGAAVGGIREKVLAAQRAGLTRIVVPAENEPDLDELPAESREALEFVLADGIEEVLAAAFAGTRAGRVRGSPGRSAQPQPPGARCRLQGRRRGRIRLTDERKGSDGEDEGQGRRHGRQRQAVRRARAQGRGAAREREERVHRRAARSTTSCSATAA